jgi:hypothetical protein
LLPSKEKTDLHPLRYLHFLAVAYVALSAIEPYRDRIGQGITRVIVTVGQQSLATFLASVAMARIAWIALDWTGRSPLPVALANLAGFASIVAAAYVVKWFKSEPWAGPPRPPAAMAVPAVSTPVSARHS